MLPYTQKNYLNHFTGTLFLVFNYFRVWILESVLGEEQPNIIFLCFPSLWQTYLLTPCEAIAPQVGNQCTIVFSTWRPQYMGQDAMWHARSRACPLWSNEATQLHWPRKPHTPAQALRCSSIFMLLLYFSFSTCGYIALQLVKTTKNNKNKLVQPVYYFKMIKMDTSLYQRQCEPAVQPCGCFYI